MNAIDFNDLELGQSARIVAYKLESSLTQRLQVLGLVPGTILTLIRRAPLGDPAEIKVRGAHFSIRSKDIDCLELQAA